MCHYGTYNYDGRERQKTDKRDAELIAKCLAYGTYKSVYVLTGEDAEVKEYMRMRDDHKLAIKKIKQQNLALCLRYGCKYPSSKAKWTQVHLDYIKSLDLTPDIKETMNEYLHTFTWLIDKIKALDTRILEFTNQVTLC